MEGRRNKAKLLQEKEEKEAKGRKFKEEEEQVMSIPLNMMDFVFK